MLRPRHVQLAARDLPVADHPVVLAVVLAHALERVARVVGRDQRDGPVAAAGRVDHDARARRNQLEPVQRPLRPRVPDGVGVVPHPGEVSHVAADPLDLLMHGAVGVVVRPHEDVLWRRAEVRGPLPPDDVEVAADPAGGDHHGLGGDLVLVPAVLRRHAAAGDPLPFLDQPGHARAEPKLQLAAPRVRLDGGPHLVHERLPAAPREVEAGDRVAVPVGAALGPVDDREEAHAVPLEPAPHLVARPRHVLVGPAPRPEVVLAELRDPSPIRQRQLDRIPDARAPLLRRVDHEHPAEGLPGEAAELLRVAAIDQQDAAAVFEQLKCRHEAGDAGAHDHDVGLALPGTHPGRKLITSLRRPALPPARQRARAPTGARRCAGRAARRRRPWSSRGARACRSASGSSWGS